MGHVYPSQIPIMDTGARIFKHFVSVWIVLVPLPPQDRASSWPAAELPPASPSTTGARGSATSDAGLAQGIIGSGLPTPVPALRPTPAPTQTHSPCTFACEIAQGRPAEARRPTSRTRVSLGLRPRALMQSSASPRDLADGVRRMSLRGRRPRPCAAARARFSPIRPSYSPTVPRSAWERMFELPPGPPPGPGRRISSAQVLGKWAGGRQPPSATLLPLSAPSAAPQRRAR